MKTYLSTGILFAIIVLYLMVCSIGATIVNSEPLFLLLMIPCSVASYYLVRCRFKVPFNFTIIFEIIYGAALSYLLYSYTEVRLSPDEAIVYTALFAVLILLILIAAWRVNLKSDKSRKWFEKYLHVIAMMLLLVLGVAYINSLS